MFCHGQEILKDTRSRGGKEHDSDLTLSELQQVVQEFKKLASVPEDPWKQLHEALEAVFNSWLSPRYGYNNTLSSCFITHPHPPLWIYFSPPLLSSVPSRTAISTTFLGTLARPSPCRAWYMAT